MGNIMTDIQTQSMFIWFKKCFRELGEEGLLANDIFVDTRIQMEEKLAKRSVFLYALSVQ